MLNILRLDLPLVELFWRTVTILAVEQKNVLQSQQQPIYADYVAPWRIRNRYHKLPDVPIYMSQNTPISEQLGPHQSYVRRVVNWLFIQEILRLKERIGLSRWYQSRYTGGSAPYPKAYERLFPKPEFPEDFRPGADKLARLASRGPFSLLTKKEDESGDFVLDMRAYEVLQPREPFTTVGGLARFKRHSTDGSLYTTCVEFRGKTYARSGDPDAYALAEKRVLVALNTQTTAIEHLVHQHLLSAGTWSQAQYLTLSAHHPLRVLLSPFMAETMLVNNDQIDGLIKSEQSNVPAYTGYPLAIIGALIQQVADRFDASILDPEHRARVQGQLGDPTFPTVQSLVEIFCIFKNFAREWCVAYLSELNHHQTVKFCETLDAMVPNGVRNLAGVVHGWENVTVDQVAHLAAVVMFNASIEHHLVADWPPAYQLQPHIMPPAMDEEGYPTTGIVYEKRDSVVVASIKRYLLLDDDFRMPTAAMQCIWKKFQDDLKAYEEASKSNPATFEYVLKPSRASRSVHA